MKKRMLILRTHLSSALVLAILLSMFPVPAITVNAEELDTVSQDVTEPVIFAPVTEVTSETLPPSELEETVPGATVETVSNHTEETPVQETDIENEYPTGFDRSQMDSSTEDINNSADSDELAWAESSSEEFYGFEGVTSADDTVSFFAGTGLVTNPTAAKWIDRLSLEQPYINFYSWLGEQTDGDYTDALIIGSYTNSEGNSVQTYPVVIFSHTVEYPDVDFTNADNRKAAFSDAKNLTVFTYEEEIYMAQQSLRAVYPAFLRDHPDLFWLSGDMYMSMKTGQTCSYSTAGKGGTVSTNISICFGLNSMTDSTNKTYCVFESDYLNNPSAIFADINRRDAAIASIIDSMGSDIGQDASRYEKISWLNDYLTKSNCYNTYVANGNEAQAGFHAWTCLGALLHHTGINAPVCESYAKAFMLLCQTAGITSILVDGTGNGGAHMWNYVLMEDNNWYLCDVTWNDPITGSENAVSGAENQHYLLKGSDAVSSSHIVVNAPLSNGITFGTGPILNTKDYQVGPGYPITGSCGENLTWVLDETGTLSISGQGPMDDFTETDIPWKEYRNLIYFVEIEEGITRIGNYAFYGCACMNSVTLPVSVTEIGAYAFDLDGLDSCYLETVYYNGSMAKWDAIQIAENNFGIRYVQLLQITDERVCGYDVYWDFDAETGLLTISGTGEMYIAPWQEIYKYQITKVIIEKGVTSICATAFEGCQNIISIEIGENVALIEEYAFVSCSGLKEIFFAGNAPEIISHAVPSSGVFDGVTADAYYPGNDTSWEDVITSQYGGTISWKAVYQILLGADSYIMQNDVLSIQIDTDSSKLTNVFVDNNLVDPMNYTVTTAGMMVTFHEDYLNTIVEGSHKVLFQFTDGIAETSFVIADRSVAQITDASGTVTGYDSLSEAVSAAANGQTITLLMDTAEEMIYLRKEKTIDLNGHALTVDLFIGVNGTNLIDSSSDNTGILIAEADAVQLSISNEQFPVYTGIGYVFTEILKYNHLLQNTADKENTQYITQPMFEPFVHKYLGTDHDEMDVAVRLSWNFGTGISNHNFFYFNTQINNVTSSYNTVTGKYGRAYSAVIKGIIDTDTYTLTGVLISSTGVEICAVDVTDLIDAR